MPDDADLNFDDRTPPQNIDAEEAILGGILLDPEALARVSELLKPEMFYVGSHQEVFKAALQLNAQSLPTDLLSISAYLEDSKTLERVGGAPYLRRLLESTVNAVNVDQYAKIVADKYIRRQLIRAGQEAAALGYNATTGISYLLDKAEQLIFEVTQGRIQRSVVPISEILMEVFAQIESRHENGAEFTGIPCAFYDLDAITGGFNPSDLIIVAARPAMGKTAFCLSIGHNIANICNLPVICFSLEMSKEQLVQRLLCSEAGVDGSRLRSGSVSELEWQKLGQTMGRLANLPFYIDDTASITLNEIRSKARRLKAENGGRLGMVLIDYLQLMEGSGDNRVQEIARITRGLKAMARELQTPVMALSQLSRGVESRTSKRPMLSDLRESGSIEQDADIVMMLYRDEYYNPETTERGIAEIIVAKHRNGPVGTVKLLFEGQYTRFKNLYKDNK
ncbi:replicative DNA helicase [Anthocerotibacter panamensis]|uniref:replicative DNA helicase n=1 Tax=Anthocerotibacter panamensis TaxID=2857077 RepID=UPI001C405B8F|nr:replicative DNA helicase [Anthocerotibacter panamensis]